MNEICRENLFPVYFPNLQFLSFVDHVPEIRSATGLYVRHGEQLTLNCSIDILKRQDFTIEWTLPNENISFAVQFSNVFPTYNGRSVIVSLIRKTELLCSQKQ